MTDLNNHLPSVEKVRQSYQALPAYSLLLGMEDDNSPLMLDLTEPGTGSFLVVGDVEESNRRVLDSMLASAYRQNTQYELSVHLITRDEGHLRAPEKHVQVRSAIPPGDPVVEVLLGELCQLLNERQDDRIELPVQLLVIDGLPEVLAKLSPQARLWLLRLIKHGPFWGMWVIGAMTTDQLAAQDYEFIESFPSRVVGRIENKEFARYFTGLPLANLRDLTPVEAVVRAGENIFTVWIPKSKSDRI